MAKGKLFEQIRSAVANDRFFVAWHADERCEERGITAWQLVAGLEEAELVRERPRSKPNPSVVVRQILEDGNEVEVIWSWLGETRQAKLVTVYLQRPKTRLGLPIFTLATDRAPEFCVVIVVMRSLRF